jgi:hypothetical protein
MQGSGSPCLVSVGNAGNGGDGVGEEEEVGVQLCARWNAKTQNPECIIEAVLVFIPGCFWVWAVPGLSVVARNA